MKDVDKKNHVIDTVKNYIKSVQNSGIDTSKSSQCYYALWAETPGRARLKYWYKGWLYLFKFLYVNFKNIIAIAAHTKLIEIGKDKEFNEAKILVVTWAFKNSFKEDGSFFDKYFNENSKNLKDSYWVLISTDNYVPSNLNSNLKLLITKKSFFKYSFFSFFKILFTTIFECRFSIKKIFHYFSSSTYFAEQMSSVIKNILKKNNFCKILMPYEAQPFQNKIFLEAKKYNKKISTFGYIHSMLTPVPCDFIFRNGAPDLLFVHGSSQVNILTTKLNWSKNKILLIKSLRFREENKKPMAGKIFLPLTILNNDKLILAFLNMLAKYPSNSFKKMDVINHPAMLNSKKHITLKKEIENLMEANKDKFSNTSDSKTSIFFGVTAAIFEALENGNKVLHVCSDPEFEALNEEIWPNLRIKKINQYVFEYVLMIQGKYINFGNNKHGLEKIIKEVYAK